MQIEIMCVAVCLAVIYFDTFEFIVIFCTFHIWADITGFMSPWNDVTLCSFDPVMSGLVCLHNIMATVMACIHVDISSIAFAIYSKVKNLMTMDALLGNLRVGG